MTLFEQLCNDAIRLNIWLSSDYQCVRLLDAFVVVLGAVCNFGKAFVTEVPYINAEPMLFFVFENVFLIKDGLVFVGD